MDVFAFFLLQLGLAVLGIMLALDLARLATFLFYQKGKNRLAQKSMIAPLVGTKIYSPKNLLLTCIIIPSCYFAIRLLSPGTPISRTDAALWKELIATYLISLLAFLLITLSARLGKTWQISASRTQAKIIFSAELLLLAALFFILLTFH